MDLDRALFLLGACAQREGRQGTPPSAKRLRIVGAGENAAGLHKQCVVSTAPREVGETVGRGACRAVQLESLTRLVQQDGRLALRAAKTCGLLPRADGLVYFSRAQGFFPAFVYDVDFHRMIQEVADAYEQTGEDAMKAFIKDVAAEEKGLKGLLVINNVPKDILELSIERLLASEVSDNLGLENCYEIFQRVLIASRLKPNQNLEAFINVLLKSNPNNKKSIHDMCLKASRESLKVDPNGLRGPCAIRIIQIALNQFPHVDDEYGKFLAILFERPSSVEFRLLISWLTQLLSSDPAWALSAQRRVVNSSQLRQMKCRARYITAIRELSDQTEKQEKTEASELSACFIEMFRKNGGMIPGKLRMLRIARPAFFENNVLPMIEANGNEDAKILIQVIKREWPFLKWNPISKQSHFEPNEETASALVIRISGLLTVEEVNKVAAMSEVEFGAYLEALRKNITTFCMLTDGPSHTLITSCINLFRYSSCFGPRYQELQTLVLTSEPHLGTVLLESLADEVLFSTIYHQNNRLLVQMVNALPGNRQEQIGVFFHRLVEKSCTLGNIEFGYKSLSVYASFCRLPSSEYRSPAMKWLRQRIEECQFGITRPSINQLDEYDTYVADGEEAIFSDPLAIFELELRCNFHLDSVRAVYFLKRTLKERYSPELAIERGLRAMLWGVIREEIESPSCTIIAALEQLVTDLALWDKCKLIFLEIWRQVAQEVAHDEYQLSRATLAILETATGLFHSFRLNMSVNEGAVFELERHKAMEDLCLKRLPTPLPEKIALLFDKVLFIV